MTSQIEVGFRIYSTVVKAEHLGSRDILFYENRSLVSYAINEIIQKSRTLTMEARSTSLQRASARVLFVVPSDLEPWKMTHSRYARNEIILKSIHHIRK